MRFITVMMVYIIAQAVLAQNITVENFNHHKHYFWQINSSMPLDKNKAVVMFKTEIKGFEFKTSNGDPIDFEEGDDGILLKVPDRTKYIVISHPEFGDYAWRVPVKYLKKHNFYTADLSSIDLTKEFKNSNQWLVINTSPENAILTIDSTMHRISDGTISLYLPLGKHAFTLESPFYESMTDTLNLTENFRMEKQIMLQPMYSYLLVKTEDEKAEIYVDEQFQGSGFITTGRLGDGHHRVSLLKNNQWVKDTVVGLGRSEKKLLIFPENYSNGSVRVLSEKFEKNPAPNIYRELSLMKHDSQDLLYQLKSERASLNRAPVHFMTEDSLTRIIIDREFMGTGEWAGDLSFGFHIITTEKDGYESVSDHIEIIDDSPKEIKLPVPKSSVGKVNIKSNIPGAEIFEAEQFLGLTPSIIDNLKADELHHIKIKKNGYKKEEITVRPKGNSIIDIYIELKKL